MHLLHIAPDCPVYFCPRGPSLFGKTNWGKVNRFDKVIDCPAIGRGAAFETGRVFRSFKMVFVKGRSWEETPLYRHAAAQIRAGRAMWKCTSPEALLRRLEHDVETLYRSMQAHGFLLQEQVSRRIEASDGPLLQPFGAAAYPSTIRGSHEIKIALNEAGDILFLDGRHRFGIARLLGLPAIPCRVVFRHRDWMRRRALLEETAAEAGPASGPLQSVLHPDLVHLRFSKPAMSGVPAAFAARGWDLPEYWHPREVR